MARRASGTLESMNEKANRPLKIRIVAPAGPVNGPDLTAGVQLLRGRGHEVVEADHVRKRKGYLAGSDADRLGDLQGALDAPGVDVVWFARGGYGTTRLLGGLKREGLIRHPKIISGFSDATALYAWAQRVPCATLLYAPSAQELARKGVCVLDSVWAALAGSPLPLPGEGGGPAGPFPVAGGCLTLLSVLVGTPWEPAIAGRWLFLEEVGESMYRIDRMLTHLEQAGWFERAAGVLLGGFTGMGDGEGPGDVARRVRELLGPDKPAVTGLPVGHRTGKYVLPLERPALWDGRHLVFP